VRCYIHSEHEAVGICKACGKGLCRDCAVDLGHGLACHGEHEQRVAAVEAMVSRAARVQKTAGRARYGTAAFLGFMGIVFTGYGLMQTGKDKFLILLGVGFLAYGAYAFVANRRAYGANKADA
jgi:hypothetical protein